MRLHLIYISLISLLISLLPESAFAAEPEDTAATMLEEVVVKAKRNKYSKKNNPAVELMQRIRKAAEASSPKQLPQYSYDKYDKQVLALNDFDPSRDKGFLAKHLNFIFEFIDTSEISGHPILPISINESSSRVLYRKEPKAEKEVVQGMRSQGLIQQLNDEGVQKFLRDVLREIDIYSNDIPLMQNRFVSPLSHIADNYYKFFLDTVDTPKGRMLELKFAPHNPESLGFNGYLYIPADAKEPYVQRLTMQTPRAINLNYVKSLYVVQEYELDSLGTRHKTRDDMTVEFEIIPGTQGLYARRQSFAENFSSAPLEPEDTKYLSQSGDKIIAEGAMNQPDLFWNDKRQSPIRPKEDAIKMLLAMLRQHRWFYWTEKTIHVLVSGYLPTGKDSKVDIGPVNTMISANTVEGLRLRLGGMTTASLSKHWFARAYGAYGFKDHRWKYGAELEYSFNRKKEHSREWPIRSLKLSHNYDLDMIGQHYLFTNADNVFLSWKRKESDKVTYRRLTRLDYTLELPGGFSLQAGLKMERQQPSHWLPFEDGYGNVFGHYNQSAASVQLRFAPGETYYQTRSNRIPINMDAPIFILSHEYGPKGLFGSDFCTNKTEFSAQKRFWFSTFGYTDILVKAAKIWSQVQYPALTWANANLSYTVQPESFALMNPMEFATDQFLSWDLTYWGNGVIFNRVPFIKLLRFREVFTFRGLYGSLTDKNNPALNNNLFRFPFDSFAKPMHGEPYMEVGVGIDNILTILRIDYVWRLTYRDTPNADKSGLRVSLHFQF